MEYLIILVALFFITLLLENTHHIKIYHTFKEGLVVAGLFFIIGVVWDTFAIWRGHWVFPLGRNAGIVIGLMPVEEYLFVLIVPYFIITVYRLIYDKTEKKAQ